MYRYLCPCLSVNMRFVYLIIMKNCSLINDVALNMAMIIILLILALWKILIEKGI